MPTSRHRSTALVAEPGPYDNLLCFNFYVGWRAIQEFYAPAFPPELNPQRMYVLGMCHGKGASVRSIAEILHIDDAAVSNILNRLQSDGLVQRRKDASDGRGVISRITPKGRKLVFQTDERLRLLDQQLAGYVSRPDANAVARVVKGLLKSNSGSL